MPTTDSAEPIRVPDYNLDDYVEASTPAQLKALGDETRTRILALLAERAATTSRLAEALGKPKGTIGYHLEVLAEAGLVRVVRTRKVRAITEKFYGRTARTIVVQGLPEGKSPLYMLAEAMEEAKIEEGAPLPMATIRRARLSVEDAMEFAKRINDLVEEFLALPRSGDTVYGFVAAVYPTDLPTLEEEHA